jgi:4-alpha-glucanotransferase
MFAGFGLFFVAWSFAQYQMGSAVRMGPGYFPAVLGGLLLALVAENLWRWSPEQPLPAYSAALSRAVHAFLGLSRANVAMIQVEDLIGMGDPVNVPGTDTEHPNWQRKVTQDTADIFARTEVRDILAAVNSARRGVNPNT